MRASLSLFLFVFVLESSRASRSGSEIVPLTRSRTCASQVDARSHRADDALARERGGGGGTDVVSHINMHGCAGMGSSRSAGIINPCADPAATKSSWIDARLYPPPLPRIVPL